MEIDKLIMDLLQLKSDLSEQETQLTPEETAVILYHVQKAIEAAKQAKEDSENPPPKLYAN